MTGLRPARVRFYVDQDVVGMGRVLASLRSDVTFVGDPGAVIHKRTRPPAPVSPGALDPDWIPVVAREGWVILSRDGRIQDSLSELSAVRDSNAKMVCLTGDAAATKWTQLEAVMTRWRSIEALADRPGPWVFKLSRHGLREVDIDVALDRLRQRRPHR
jgi:hypothetical protein